MYVVESVQQVFETYMGQTVFLTLFLVSLIYCFCKVDEKGYLTDIVETSNVCKDGSRAYIKEEDGQRDIDFFCPVSMNMWGFTPDFLGELKDRFVTFLDQMENPLKSEYLLPEVVGNLIKEELAEVSVLHTNDKWFGVTYQEDKQYVIDSFAALTREGIYPEHLFP